MSASFSTIGIAIVLFLLLGLGACQHPKPLLSWGAGGGFTGTQHGYTAYSNGTVETWTQHIGQPRQLQQSWKLNPAQQQTLQSIYQQLQALWPYLKPANYTHFITLYTLQDTLYWAWGPADPQAIAQTLQTLYELLNRELKRP